MDHIDTGTITLTSSGWTLHVRAKEYCSNNVLEMTEDSEIFLEKSELELEQPETIYERVSLHLTKT